MDPKHVVNLSGKDYPLFAGILAEAHERGLVGIETQLIQIPTADNDCVAIVKAIVRMKDGSVFEDYGDASPRNTSARIANALIRMASTRSKGRALRDAVNIGQTMLEELGDLEDAPGPAEGARSPVERPAAPRNGGSQSEGQTREERPLRCSIAACGKALTPAQVTASEHHSPGRLLCPSCRQKVSRTP